MKYILVGAFRQFHYNFVKQWLQTPHPGQDGSGGGAAETILSLYQLEQILQESPGGYSKVTVMVTFM